MLEADALATLRRLVLKGFKSIKVLDLELRSLNVLIGANGAGKSNLVSFFKMLNEMMAGRLQQYIGTAGRAQALLRFGPKVTSEIDVGLEILADSEFERQGEIALYSMSLAHAAGDKLIFSSETVEVKGPFAPNAFDFGSGQQETCLREPNFREFPWSQKAIRTIRHFLNDCRVYHFHDTSSSARVKQYCYIGDNQLLLSDGGNLAAFLLRLRDEHRTVYNRILSTIRLIAPFFEDFDLDFPGTGSDLILNWRNKGSDQVFGPHQLSDGTLRAICLITLLMQPEKELPDLIIVDEPELGLHPYALNVIAALFKKASHHTQVIISTQSSSFLDNFKPEDVVVVNREGQESKFTRLDPTSLDSWLEDYSLGEVWEKNVIGGGPH